MQHYGCCIIWQEILWSKKISTKNYVAFWEKMEMWPLEAWQSCLTWKLVSRSLQGKWIFQVQTRFCNWIYIITTGRRRPEELELKFWYFYSSRLTPVFAQNRRILEKDAVLGGFLVPAEVCDLTDCSILNLCCVDF